MKRKIKVVIDRSKWRTGCDSENRTGEGYTELLNKEGYMCCLGFCMNASKVAKKDLRSRTNPASVVRRLIKCDNHDKLNSIFRSNGVRALTTPEGESTDLAGKAIGINDKMGTTPEEKEQKLLELFKDSVFDIEFTGSYQR